MDLPFFKYHGLGNDFIVAFGFDSPAKIERLATRAAPLCDRHRGIGGDGLLLVLPPIRPEAEARMRVLNADGSEPEMCGNGLRCVAKALADHRLPANETSVAIETGAGLLRAELHRNAGGVVEEVSVEMGPPRFDRASLKIGGSGEFIAKPILAQGRSLLGNGVSMGNPHLVIFVDDDEDLRRLTLEVGPELEDHPAFSERTNVELARMADGRLELWVWERGCGLTQACGTGACAAAAAAVKTGRHRAGDPLPVELPGGQLEIRVAADLGGVTMRGPAESVFEGVLKI